MRITRRNRSSERNRSLGRDIAEAASARSVEGRVCGEGCIMKCSSCGSTRCQCACSPHCPQAARALSVDPDDYPIESAILPLVFEMKRLSMFSPCWSCEGHARPDGSLWKLPKVWFYCDSTVAVRLLADGLGALKQAGKLRTPWQVVVTFSDPDNPDTTFSLEPVTSPGSAIALRSLQDDVAEIARSLKTMIGTEARSLQREARDALAGKG